MVNIKSCLDLQTCLIYTDFSEKKIERMALPPTNLRLFYTQNSLMTVYQNTPIITNQGL